MKKIVFASFLIVSFGFSQAFSAGEPAIPAPALKVGDSWTYEIKDGYNRLLKDRVRQDLTEIKDQSLEIRVVGQSGAEQDRQVYSSQWNWVSSPLLGNNRRNFDPPYAAFAFPLEVGKSWTEQSTVEDPVSGKKNIIKVYGKVMGWEKIKVPAGEFDALKVTRRVYMDDREWWRSGTKIYEVDWYAPAARQVVKRTHQSGYFDLAQDDRPFMDGNRYWVELTEYRLN